MNFNIENKPLNISLTVVKTYKENWIPTLRELDKDKVFETIIPDLSQDACMIGYKGTNYFIFTTNETRLPRVIHQIYHVIDDSLTRRDFIKDNELVAHLLEYYTEEVLKNIYPNLHLLQHESISAN